MPSSVFNPCELENEHEQVPAKIWELLRRNAAFCADLERLRRLEHQVQIDRSKGGKHHNPVWEESRDLVQKVKQHNAFAGIALEWLVPEPLLIISRWTAASDGGAVRREVCEARPQDLAAPEKWAWRDDTKPNLQGGLQVRGPEIHFRESNLRRFCDRRVFLNEWRDWKPGDTLFDCDSPWPKTPAGFRQWFQFNWRRNYDSSATNPITGKRSDCANPHETDFFQGWNLEDFRSAPASGISVGELKLIIRFKDLAEDYRVFAIPRTVLTRQEANTLGAWLARELKLGLRNRRELMGSFQEWKDWLSAGVGHPSGVKKETHFYRRCKYVEGLADQIYPHFDIESLLAAPKHRARGKRYVPKGGQS